MNLKIDFKTITLYGFVFIILYFDQIEIVKGFSLSTIWKILLIVICVHFVLKRKVSHSIIFVSIIIALKFIIHAKFMYNIVIDLTEAIFFISFPFFIFFFYTWFRNKPEKLKLFIIHISSFIILSSVPFIFGLLDSRGGDLEYMGIEGNKLIGLFPAVAIASKTFAIATLVVFSFKRVYNESNLKIFFWLLIFMGTLATFKTMGRIGWAILVVGFVGFVYKNYGITYFLICGIGILFLISTVNFSKLDLYKNAYYLKLTGSTKNKKNYKNLDYNTISSGRFELYEYSLTNFTEQDLFYQLLGYGKKYATELMFQKRKSYLTAHNRFLEILEFTGVLGLFWFLIFLFKLKKLIFNSILRPPLLLKYLFVVYFFSLFPSHGIGFYGNFVFSSVIALHLIKCYDFQKRKV